MEAIRENLDSIAEIKVAIATHRITRAAEAWFELDDRIKHLLWVAPTKGGIFTTEERRMMASREFREAFYGPDQ